MDSDEEEKGEEKVRRERRELQQRLAASVITLR